MNSKVIFKVLIVVMLLVSAGLLVGAVATGSDEMIGYNLVWAYFLAAFAIVAALLCAVVGLVSAPSGLKGTILSVALVAIVIGAAISVANGHSIEIPNVGEGGVFGESETKLTDASILVTYVVFGAVVVVALLSEVMGAIGGGVAKK